MHRGKRWRDEIQSRALLEVFDKMDLEAARRNMITQQIRAWSVLDDDVLALLASLPREQFIPAPYREFAFVDMPTPIGHGQAMWSPKEEGRVLQALQILPTETVLEIGTGTGYLTALLAKQAYHVYSVDILPAMIELARVNLAHAEIDNVTLDARDGSKGWPSHAPYDVIVVTGSLALLPTEFKQQLKVGGRIFAVLGHPPSMKAMILTQRDQNRWNEQSLYETVLARLQNNVQAPSFRF